MNSNIEQLRELIRTAEGSISMIELGLMRPMSGEDLKRYPKPCDCDFVIGNFSVKDLRPKEFIFHERTSEL